jgi:uncharacterized protein (TIGR03086 family)
VCRPHPHRNADRGVGAQLALRLDRGPGRAREGGAEAVWLGGEHVPAVTLAAFLIGDLLLHSWDLARSIGADEALPPDAVEATTIGLHHVPPALLRGTNPLGQKMMAAAVEVPADASPQDKMLAFTGRRP